MAAAGLQPHAPAGDAEPLSASTPQVSGIERCMTGQAELEFGIVIPVMDYIIKWTPLHFASENGHFAVAELLAAKGADLEAKDQYEWTPLHFASRYGHFAVAELLAAKGADLEAKAQYGATPLHFASFNGHFAVAELLAAKGADLGAKDDRGATPLHFASENGHFAVAELLAAKGADLEAKAQYGKAISETTDAQWKNRRAALAKGSFISAIIS
nr:ankyrin repeat domain-containing protein 1-like [Penaeus vannamei]